MAIKGWTEQHERFVAESNRIEGIKRVTQYERDAHKELWSLEEVLVGDVEKFVARVAKAELRDRVGMNVRVGTHVPPRGGPRIRSDLVDLLAAMNERRPPVPYYWHCEYETLHPFMDGNGRSGRALWAWHMMHVGHDPFALGFLHTFYYQALDADRNVVVGAAGKK